MKVLILANNDGGLISFRRELLETLVKTHTVYCCTPGGSAFDVIRSIGCQVIPVQMDRHGTNPLKELKLLRFYRRTLKEIKPDIVLTYTIKPNVYGGMACASLRIPYVANITGLGSAVENGGLMQRISTALYKIGLRKARKVFFQNKENLKFMVDRGMVKGPYDLLPGSGVNLQKYTVSEYPLGETVDFVFVARIMKEKGIEEYLAAAEHIRGKYPQTRFHICGACEENYVARLDELGRRGIVEYHGSVSDMRPIYRMISCTVHPSFYPEGLSNVLLESAASGRPIITTDRAGCREVIEDGVNGFMVKQRDSQDLIDKIEKFLSLSWEQRRDMGLAGRAKVEREFDRQIVIDKYVKEIDHVGL